MQNNGLVRKTNNLLGLYMVGIVLLLPMENCMIISDEYLPASMYNIYIIISSGNSRNNRVGWWNDDIKGVRLVSTE